MRIIGLIGGMSWESTAIYYRHINEAMRLRRGSLHSAEILLRSVDFSRIVALQTKGAWDEASNVLCNIARDLERAGASCILICTNTMHKLAPAVSAAVSIPLLHIADTTGDAVVAAGSKRPLLLATRYTMEQNFYIDRLREKFALDPIVPNEADRAVVHNVIFKELCCGVINDDSRKVFLDIVARGQAAGADGVILGCTEIGLLIGPEHIAIPTLDSTILHANAGVEYSLQDIEAEPQMDAA